MKRQRLIPVILSLLVVGFGLFGVMHRSTYTDLTAQPNYIQDFMVAELHGDLAEDACQFQAQELPNSPIIARVTPTSELEPLFFAARQQFLVQEVFALQTSTSVTTYIIATKNQAENGTFGAIITAWQEALLL